MSKSEQSESPLCDPYAEDPESCKHQKENDTASSAIMSRRGFGAAVMAAGVAATSAGADFVYPQPASAVMGMTAGRVPGLAPADKDGIRRYTRPEGKSGGHGVGWSEITPYSFDVYEGWEETPVSIADPGGTEIDAKFNSDNDGGLKVVLAPVLRFADVKEGTNPGIEELISFDRFMPGFGPELTQNPVNEEDIVDSFKVGGTGGTGAQTGPVSVSFFFIIIITHILSRTIYVNNISTCQHAGIFYLG